MNIIKVTSISEMHKMFGLEPPKHPLITFFNWDDATFMDKPETEVQVSLDFYMISQKTLTSGAIRYGRNYYDFNEGVLMFIAPGQVVSSSDETEVEAEGWALFFHPDLVRKTSLGKKMSEYTFFSYDVHEALHLSEEEKKIITGIAYQTREEYSKNIDIYTQDLIVSQLEVLLNYASRFYGRQFITRTNHNSDLISRFESDLNKYFDSEKPKDLGLPTVKECAKNLGMSPDYLSDMLKQETGKNAQEHIHYMLIDRAKTLLLGTSHSVSEIAYSLGFEYPQYFSKLFKKKTGMTPVEFRNN